MTLGVSKETIIELRRHHPQLIRNLIRLGPPNVICFDSYFSDPYSGTDVDAEFQRALREAGEIHQVPVVVGKYFDPMDKTFSDTAPALAPYVTEGHVTLDPSDDNVIRRLPLVIRHRSPWPNRPIAEIEDYPAFVLQAGLLAEIKRPFKKGADLHPGRKIDAHNSDKGLSWQIPIARTDAPLKNYLDKYDGEVFIINYPSRQDLMKLRKGGAQYRSYKDVIADNPSLARDAFRNKCVIIGATDQDLEPPVAIPVEPQVYPCEIHASALNTILNKSYIKRADPVLTPVIMALASVIVFLVGCVLPRRWYLGLFFIAVIVWWIVLIEVPSRAYQFDFLWLEATYPTGAVLATALCVIFYRRELWRDRESKRIPAKEG
jgi:CHASE2 domain-containing sensor protein